MSTLNPETKILELTRENEKLKSKIKFLESEKQNLESLLEKANRVIDAFKRTGKPPPNKVKLGFPPSNSNNMI